MRRGGGGIAKDGDNKNKDCRSPTRIGGQLNSFGPREGGNYYNETLSSVLD